MGDTELLSRATRLMVGRGLVSAADIHRFGVRARDLSQSNSVVLVECGDGRGYVVKDMRRRDEEKQGSPAAELALYKSVSGHSELRSLVPEFLDYDGELEVLILEGLISSRRLDQSDGGRRALDPEVAEWLGGALGRWHRHATVLMGELEAADPWMLHIDSENRLAILDAEDRLKEVVGRILTNAATAEIPLRVRQDWRSETVIHGDVRFANVLVNIAPPAVRFIDWETGGSGDPAWDVGAAVQEFLSVGIGGGHRTLAGSPSLPAIEALLSAYRTVSGSRMSWRRLAPFVACRLLMRAVQLANWEGNPGDSIDIHLEMAEAAAGSQEPFGPDLEAGSR